MSGTRLLLIILVTPLTSVVSTARPPANAAANITPSRPSVLLITLDTVRADHIACYGYNMIRTPALDAIASEGVRFARAYAQVPITLPSHAVILTGSYPMSNRVRDFTSSGLPSDIPSLAEVMHRAGYRTAAFVSAFALHSTWGLNRGFDTYDDQMDAAGSQRNPLLVTRAGGVTASRLLAWLDEHPQEPIFVWLHLYDAHSPYRSPQSYRNQYRGRPYDAAIAFDDAQVSRVIERLRESKRYDGMLIVVASDHGESLGEHGEAEHGFFIYDSTVHVPLILRLPGGGGAGRVVTSPVGTIDLAPTIAQVCRIPSSETRSFQGASLLRWIGSGPGPEDERVYAESYYPHDSFGWHELRGIITRRYKFIDAPHAELYDLQSDPGEHSNLLAADSEVVSSLRANLEALEQKFEGRERAATGLDAETVEKLKALGYVAYKAGGQGVVRSSTEADPKLEIATFNQILHASDLTRAGKYDEAERLLQKLGEREPQLYVVPFQTGENDLAWNKPGKAIDEFRRTLQLNPHFDQALLGLGRAYFEEGQNENAATAFRLALQINPRNFLGRLALAKVYIRENTLDEANAELRRVIEEQPGIAEGHALYGITLAKQRNYDQGKNEIQRGLELGYREPIAFNYLGVSQAETGRPREAIEAYQKALQLDPRYAAACMNLALQYRRLGEPSEALHYYRKLCELSSSLCRQYASQFRAR